MEDTNELYKLALSAIFDALDKYDGVYSPNPPAMEDFVLQGDKLCECIEFDTGYPNEPELVAVDTLDDDSGVLYLRFRYIMPSFVVGFESEDELRDWGVDIEIEPVQTEDGVKIRVDFMLCGLWLSNDDKEASNE